MALILVLVTGCAVREASQVLQLESATEANVLQEELLSLGFDRAGHSDGDAVDAQGVPYAVAGYGYVGEYQGVKTEVELRALSPTPASKLPTKHSLTVRCRARQDAEATSQRLVEELKKRLQQRMAHNAINTNKQ